MDPEKTTIATADVVSSTAGRDQGELFYVLETDDQFVTLVNGRNRPVEKPKRKKRKHVEKVLRSETRVAEKLRSGDKVLNGELRRDLASLSRSMQGKNLGG
jgi:large subunit ribosomal protein L14e